MILSNKIIFTNFVDVLSLKIKISGKFELLQSNYFGDNQKLQQVIYKNLPSIFEKKNFFLCFTLSRVVY